MTTVARATVAVSLLLLPGATLGAQVERSSGIPTSQFGIFVSRGELLVFPFAAITRDHNREYQPAQLGYGLSEDFRGHFRSTQAQLFVAYGVTDWLAIELEGARLSARLDKSPSDPSAVPARIEESGIGDIEGNVRIRFMMEGARRPQLYGFVELTPRTLAGKRLIGEQYWDAKPGVGLVRSFRWGTINARIAAEWNREAKSPDLGEVELEYLKRLTPRFGINLALAGGESGTNDEWTVVGGLRWKLTRWVALKLDGTFGIMSKATDLETQAGVLLILP